MAGAESLVRFDRLQRRLLLEQQGQQLASSSSSSLSSIICHLEPLAERALAVTFGATRNLSFVDITDRDEPKEASNRANNKLGSVHLEAGNPFRLECRPRQLAYYVFGVGLAVHLFYVVVASSRWDQQYQRWQPKLTNQALKNGTCLLQADLAVQQAAAIGFQQHPRLNAIYQFLFIEAAGSAVIVIICVIWLSLGQPFRVSALSFLVNPQGERKRIQAKLTAMVRNCFNCADNSEQVDMMMLVEQGENSDNDRSRDSSKQRLCKCKIDGLQQQQQSVAEPGSSKRCQSRSDFLRMLFAQRLDRYLKPVCFNESNRCAYQASVTACFGLFAVLILTIFTCSLLLVIVDQLRFGLQERLAKVECERWHIGAQLAKHRLDFRSDRWTQNRHLYAEYFNQHDRAFVQNNISSYQTNWTLFVKLYWLELQTFAADRNMVLPIVSLLLYATIITWWLILHMMVFTTNYHFQFVWLIDIQRQLDTINQMLACCLLDPDLALGSKHWSNNNNNKSQAPPPSASQKQRLVQIHCAIAGAYLNYELFRQQYADFLAISRLIAAFEIIHSINMAAGLYMTHNLSRDDPTGWLMAAYACLIISLVDAVFVSSSLIVYRVKRISESLVKLFAACTELSISLSYIVSLWRRQLLTNHDFRSYFATSLAGIELSQENLITFNSYLFGLGLIVYSRSR